MDTSNDTSGLKKDGVKSSKSISCQETLRTANTSCVMEKSGKYFAPNYKDYNCRKYSNDLDPKIMKNYPIRTNYKSISSNNQENKSRNSPGLPRLSNQTIDSQRENHTQRCQFSSQPKYIPPFTEHTTLEQQNLVPKMGQVNFPPLRAPQSIVNVRHPFVTESRIKQNDVTLSNVKMKPNVGTSSMQTSDSDRNAQTFHNYNANIRVQNLGNVTSIAQYPRPDSFPQATIASVLVPESSQYPQSPSYATRQFSTYDATNFTPTPVNVNPVLPQFSTDSTISYPQFENTAHYIQQNHFSAAAELANSQYQYQATGQIQDSPLFIQSLQSPIAIADQYAAPNYAQAVRTDLIPRLRRPPRFNK